MNEALKNMVFKWDIIFYYVGYCPKKDSKMTFFDYSQVIISRLWAYLSRTKGSILCFR